MTKPIHLAYNRCVGRFLDSWSARAVRDHLAGMPAEFKEAVEAAEAVDGRDRAYALIREELNRWEKGSGGARARGRDGS